MSIHDVPAGSSEASPAAPAITAPALASWPWRRAALILAGAAQLITISALAGADPIPATWSSLLLAVAPAPLAGAAAFAPSLVNVLAAAAGTAVLVVGIPGHIAHIRLFCFPALTLLAVAAVKLWREQPSEREKV